MAGLGPPTLAAHQDEMLRLIALCHYHIFEAFKIMDHSDILLSQSDADEATSAMKLVPVRSLIDIPNLGLPIGMQYVYMGISLDRGIFSGTTAVGFFWMAVPS